MVNGSTEPNDDNTNISKHNRKYSDCGHPKLGSLSVPKMIISLKAYCPGLYE